MSEKIFPDTLLTTAGRQMIVDSQGGSTLTFTRVALGDGVLAQGQDQSALTAIISEKLSANISSYTDNEDGTFSLIFSVNNSTLDVGFMHREIGIMAKVDDGEEQLYAYTNAGTAATFLYDKTTPIQERVVRIDFVVGSAENLSVEIDGSVVYPTRGEVQQMIGAHDSSAASHADLLHLRKPSTEYAVGDIAYSALLPSWAYLECTVGGTTDSGDLPVPSSVSEFSTFTDGTVTWKIQRVTGKLPLSGGTMSGKIATNQRISMTQASNNDSIVIVGGASYLNGAHVALFGNNRSDLGADRKGSFALGAVDTSQNLIELIGKSNKSLTWDGVEVKQLSFPSDTQINIHDYFTWTNPVTTPYDLWRASGYVAPSNGYFSVKAHVANGVQWGAIYISSSGGIYQSDTTFVANVTIASTIPVRKGQVLGCDLTNTDSNTMLFIPCVGEVM